MNRHNQRWLAWWHRRKRRAAKRASMKYTEAEFEKARQMGADVLRRAVLGWCLDKRHWARDLGPAKGQVMALIGELETNTRNYKVPAFRSITRVDLSPKKD